jgi:NADH:ubiquinone oxidoreductase subunit E
MPMTELGPQADREVADLAQQLDAVIAANRDRRGALIPVLQQAQSLYGHLPESALKRIALGLGMAYSEVCGVVSFYSFFSTVPRGQNLIRVCLGTACYVRNGARVLNALSESLEIGVDETTPDRAFSLGVARCFGACGLAPVIMVNDDVHHRVKPNRVEELLDAYRQPEKAKAHGRSA